MNAFLIITGLIILFVFIEPVFEDVFNFGTVTGVALGIVFVALGILRKAMGTDFPWVIIFMHFIFVIFLASLCTVIYLKGRDGRTKADAAIVLGCRVKGDTPSESLTKRVEKAYEFLTNNNESVAILSGGKGPDENISEAECMFNILCKKGISPSRLLCENKSVNTDENIRFSKEILKEKNINGDVAVISSEYHQLRAGIICKRYGIKAVARSSKTKAIVLPTFLLREVFALARELVRLRSANNV